MNNKFKPNKITNIVYYSLIFLVLLLTIIRWISAFNSDIVVINQEINSHISNFSLSLLFYLTVGFSWTLQGISFKRIVLLGIVCMIANILCETVMGFMNTPDLIDAVYGIVGTIVSFCFLWVSRKWGLTPIRKID